MNSIQLKTEHPTTEKMCSPDLDYYSKIQVKMRLCFHCLRHKSRSFTLSKPLTLKFFPHSSFKADEMHGTSPPQPVQYFGGCGPLL